MDLHPGDLHAMVKDDNLLYLEETVPDSGQRNYHKFYSELQNSSVRDWLKEIGFDVPTSTAGWKELAAVAGIPHQRILTAEFTRAEVISNLRASVRKKQWLASQEVQRLPASEGALTHTPSFTSVTAGGTSYKFKRGHQAESVRVLFEAWKDGTPEMTEKEIGESIGSNADNFQLRKVFRTKKADGGYEMHSAWETLIQKAGRGTYRLAIRTSRGAES